MEALSSSFISAFTSKSLRPRATPKTNFTATITTARIQDKPSTTTAKTQPKPPPPTPSRLSSSSSPPRRTTSNPPAAPPTLPGAILNAFDDIINNFIDPPRRPSVDPRRVLSDNFAPVAEELPPTECSVEHGTIPECLRGGAYIRNGPNPQFLPRGPYHLFDGDGMLHALFIPPGGGPPRLSSRYVKTYKYSIESAAGHPLIPNVFSGFSGVVPSAVRGAVTAARMFTGQFNPANGVGVANTSLAFFANRLFALGESDLPYEVRITPDGDITTVGRCNFDEKLTMNMTAHPKIDPGTNEIFAFRTGPVPPFLSVFRFGPNGEKHPDVPILSLRNPSFIHDFGLTKKYAIFSDIQIGMNPMEMIVGGGSPVASNPGKVPRIGVIPRYAKDDSEMRWFDVPGFNIIHAINAWDDDENGDAVVMVAPNILSVEHTLERMELVHALVEKVRIDLRTGIVSRTPISASNLDFGVINPDFVAKKSSFVYAGVGDPMPKISGVVKLDVEKVEMEGECTVAKRMFGPGCYGGEPFFVAKENATDEDDGYVLTYVHNEHTGDSRFLVMDAKSPQLEIVASVKLPRRVPYGFHGLFVKESDLNKGS